MSSGAAFLGATKLVDCTQEISETATIWPGGCPFSRAVLCGEGDGPDRGFRKERYTMGCDCGTHIDSPFHWFPKINGKKSRTISELTVDELTAPGVVVDVSAKCAENCDYELTVDDLLQWEARNGPMPERCFVAMKTGWSAKFNDAVAYTNFDGKPGVYPANPELGTPGGTMHFPGFATETAKFLIEQRSIVGIGIDTLSLDPGNSATFGTHATILGSDRFQVENLKLDGVPEAGLCFVCLPIKIKDGPEAEARVMAIVK